MVTNRLQFVLFKGHKIFHAYGLITSARKFDKFGDWYLVKNRKLTKAIFTGRDREAADSFYYDVDR